jgi:hypothetical protein
MRIESGLSLIRCRKFDRRLCWRSSLQFIGGRRGVNGDSAQLVGQGVMQLQRLTVLPALSFSFFGSKPRSSPPSRTLCSASSRAARMGSMRARNSAPDSVGTTARVVRESKTDAQTCLEIGNYTRGLGPRETTFTRCSREAAEPCDARIEVEGEYVLHISGCSYQH